MKIWYFMAGGVASVFMGIVASLVWLHVLERNVYRERGGAFK